MSRGAFIACVIACLAGSLRAQLIESDVPEQRGVGIDANIGAALPLETELTDAKGNPVTLGEFFDGERPVLIVPVYFECPVLCPTTRVNVLRALNGMTWSAGDEYRVVCYSFDHTEPARVAAAKQRATLDGYTRGYEDARETWAFLTTTDAAVARDLSSALGFYYRFVPAVNEYSHTSGVFICTPDGVVHNVIEGLDFSGEDLQRALRAARDGEERSIFDAVYTWCFPYDPETGKNTPSALRLMTIGAPGGALILFGVIGFLIYRTSSGPRRGGPA